VAERHLEPIGKGVFERLRYRVFPGVLALGIGPEKKLSKSFGESKKLLTFATRSEKGCGKQAERRRMRPESGSESSLKFWTA
jgi:hypothetical protein